MESGNGGASSEGVLVPVSETSGVFQSSILAPLKSAYLYEESKESFRYESAVLVKNPALEEKYDAFRAKRREVGYSEEDLKESYGFLLFDDVNKANALGETGVLTGNSTCTTLGDPSKGVYISMYSDCLDLNRWYHGKSGYIAIIRLTKGRVKKVLENYTQNFTAPTAGFDCHVSEQLASLSAKTSSFLAFERTQYYMYELLEDGSNATTQSPSAVCPFAIVSFSYMDTKATLAAPQEKSEDKNLVSHYFPWRGQLQIATQFYDVRLRSTAGALIPAELPLVVKIDRAISMLDLRQLLPKAVFETCFSGEVFLDGLYCSLCELVSSASEETNSLSLLLQEIKEKDIALTIQLNDGGFLILLHSCHFLTYDDPGSKATNVLQGMFVFPVSQVIQRDTKCGQRKPAISSEILQVLPVLSYAEGVVEKIPIDPGEELCEVLVQHMQSYAALINPGLASSPSRELSIFPDQYDVPDAHKHLYSSPEWTNTAWQSFRSYLSKPDSFQLLVSKASEILVAGQDEQMEDLEDDVYICLSSPEETPANPVSMESEDQLTGQRSPVNCEAPVDSCITSAEAQVDLTVGPQNVVLDDLQTVDATKDIGKSDLAVLITTDDMEATNLLTPSTSDDLPAELIVSITSAEQTVTDESLSMISTMSATKHNDFQLSVFSTAKLQMADVKSLNDGTVANKKVLDCPEVTTVTNTKRRRLRRGYSKGRKKKGKACIETPSLQIPVEDNLKSQKENQAEESFGPPQLSNPSNIDQRKVRRRKCNFRKLSSKNEKVSSASGGLAVQEEKTIGAGQQSLESIILMELEACPLRKKMERWDLKPVISECGRILVPHGSIDIADRIKSLKDKLQSTKDEQCPENMLVDASGNAHETVDTAPEMAVEETEATTAKDGGKHLQNIVSDVNPEPDILRLSDGGNGSLNQESSESSSKTEGTATPPSEAVKEKPTDTLSPEKIATTKGEFLLSKLKSVLLRGKRKTDLIVSEKTTADVAQDTEPCLKKGKVDSHTGMLKSKYAITSVQDTSVHVKEVSKMLSVDPLFAYALGLTPKEPLIQKTEGQDTQQSKDSLETQEQNGLDRQSQIIQRPPSIFPRRGRIKTLKKHQGISAENVKKKWWLHFQTPACFANEKPKHKECSRDNSVMKTVKEKMNNACSSTAALNLLADLALGASNDKVPPLPNPAHERKPETSLKKCDLTKDVTSAEQESVLRALLRQSAAKPKQPFESPSPSHFVGGSELVGLVSKEHAYSLPPSSSLLLGLPGTPFQVSPLSGSTRLLHHHQTMYGNGIKTLHPSVGQKVISEQGHRTPEYLKKHMVRRRKFRHSRTFVNKDGSIQVTKQWKENYDFNLDSKFTSDLKDRTVVRALHGPWDFSIQDTGEEVRLIVHMWIGLFYSRSTARFFHVDPCLKESDSLGMSSETASAPAQSELKANSFAPCITDTADPSISKDFDCSNKGDSVLDQGSVVLDLSLRNSNAEAVASKPQVNKERKTSVSSVPKEANVTLNTLKSSVGLQKCYQKVVQATEIISEVKDVRSTWENMSTCTPLQKAGSLERTDVPPGKGAGIVILVQEEMESVSPKPESNQTATGIGRVLHEYNSEKTDRKDSTENSEATDMILVQKHERESSVTDEEVEAGDVVDRVERDENESKDGENLEVKEKPYQESNVKPSLKVIHTHGDSTNKESGMVCNGNLKGNENQLMREEPEAVSPGKSENANEDVDCCTVHRGNVMEDEDHFGKEDGLDKRDSCVSSVEADSDLSDQPVPMMIEKKDCIIETNPEPPLDEQPPQAAAAAYHDLQLKNLRTNEHAISEGSPDGPSKLEPISNEPAVEEISKNICLADKAHNEKAASPISDENSCSLDESCRDGPIPQTHDSVETGSQNKIINLDGDDHKDRDTKSLEDSHPKGKVEEIVQGQGGMPFISESTYTETTLHTGACSTSQTAGKMSLSLIDASETNQPAVSGSESEDQCSTPTMDEKPFEYLTCSGPSSNTASTSTGSETSKKTIQKCLSRGSTSMKDAVPHKSTDDSDSNLHRDLHPDLELRTLRVLRSIGRFLSESSHTDTSSQTEMADRKFCLDQTSNPRSKYIPNCLSPSHTSSDCKAEKMSNTTPAEVSVSTSQELHTESTGHFLISPFKSELEEVLGVKLQKTVSSAQYFERTDALRETPVGQDCLYRCVPSTVSLQASKPNTDQDGHKTSQTSLSHEPRSYSQRPVMAVKPSKSDESQADYVSKDRQSENAVMAHFSKTKQTKFTVVTCSAPTTMLLENKTEKRTSEGLNDEMQEARELSSKSSWISNVIDSKSNSDPLYQHRRGDISKFSKIPSSSLHVQTFESCKLDANQGFMTCSSAEKVGQKTKERAELDQKGCSDPSTSCVDYKDGGIIDDSLFLGPQSSLMCTVYNTNRKRPHSFLEQVSQRCLQDDITEASMEQECLIFSEQMKQLLKRRKRGPIRRQDSHDKLNLSCASPVTVHFCGLEEQEESMDHFNTHLDAPSLVGQKIKVDMSDRNTLTDTTEEENTLHPQIISQGTGNPVEHAGVSAVTSECARLYEAMINDVCAAKKVPSKPKRFRMDRSYPKTEPSNHFDFCDQMKREMDQSFRSNLNSVVKKSCKTKYRFYILVTSDDAFFEETKAQLEAEGHTAVQPSEFFLGEDSFSSLLIILRNEDIAEHICEVPHLLELKKSPGVQFAGIDEPDDVVNLTHQELFTRGGFIMFDRAALEPLSLCNMKEMSEILQELSKMGKWKWMLHYRDSRRLKENARLSAEEKEKKHLLNWCQEVGILEILPYHECDIVSRDQPDYLTCLVRLQVQNISARYPVFITDTTDSTFGKNGILSMTFDSFLTYSPSETFTA